MQKRFGSGMWKNDNHRFFHIISVIIIFTGLTFSQESEKIVFPKLNHISSNAFYKGTFVTKSNDKPIPGSNISLPVITYYKFHGFEFRVSIIVREKGNISTLPVCVKLISPQNEIRMLTITEDIAHLPKNKILDFSFPLELNEMGKFLMEIVSPENLTSQADPHKEIVYYTTQINFAK